MAVNRGKQFEEQVRKGFEEVPDTFVVRLIDPQNGYAGVRNICDFVVYHGPFLYLVECKSVHGNTMSIHSNDPTKRYGMITNNQWEGMLKASRIKGVVAGIIVWFIDNDETFFISIQALEKLRSLGYKSIHYDHRWYKDIGAYGEIGVYVTGTKKRVLFDYEMKYLFDYVEDII